MKRNYYYLVAGLQDITIDVHKLQFSQLAFREELKTEVHPDDYKLVEKLFLPFDNANLLNLLQKTGKPFDEKGNFSQERLEENIKEPHDLPEYMMQFIAAFKSKDPLMPDMSPENELTTLFFDQMLGLNNEFLRNWFEFELNVQNIVTALLARKYEVPYEFQIIGTGEVAGIIRKSHARDFGLGAEIDYLEELANLVRNDNIQEREKAIDELRWKYLDEEIFFEYFTIEKILAFTIKLGMAERWLGIDKDFGNEMFKKLLKELQSSYELPESFTEK
ncbi:MAG: DUF2764 domain-containing protein [Bacteroidales bacterium]|nr:DUF2764 domain-containing protein [Bacteroidales bacterium]